MCSDVGVKAIKGCLIAIGTLVFSSHVLASVLIAPVTSVIVDGQGMITVNNNQIDAGSMFIDGTTMEPFIPAAETVDVIKEFTGTGPMMINFSVLENEIGTFQVDEAVTNNTGFDWSGYQWVISPQGEEPDPLLAQFLGVGNIQPFNFVEFNTGATSMTAVDGILTAGSTFYPVVRIDVKASGNYTLTQQPLAVPEPASVALFGLGVVGLLLQRKRSAFAS